MGSSRNSQKGCRTKELALSSTNCGTTVILCGIAADLLGSNIHTPTLMLANFVAIPIELSLVVPFLRLGEVITGGDHFSLTSDALMLGSLVAALFILVVLYFVFIPCFKFLVLKFSSHPPSPKNTHHPHPEPKPKMPGIQSLGFPVKCMNLMAMKTF